jgi:hypothetical protein
MSLFKLNDLQSFEPKKDSAPGVERSPASNSNIYNSLGHKNSTIEEMIGTLQTGTIINYKTAGRWSSHDLLLHVLKQIGPATLYFSTWTISEFAIRQLLEQANEGNLKMIHGLFDYKIPERKGKVLQLARAICTNIKLTKVHAKVWVLENKNWCVANVGSANFSNNPRIEAGVLMSNNGAGEFHRDWIIEEIAKGGKIDV